MHSVAAQEHAAESDSDVSGRKARLRAALARAAHLLPAQGPIQVFIHHNTLHAFEDLHFERAVQAGGETFGCHPFLPEERYRAEMDRGRIRREDLAAVLMDDLGDEADRLLGLLGTRFHLRLMMLLHPLRVAPSAELRWFVAETDALRRFRKDARAGAKRSVVDETRHWVMRDLRDGAASPRTRAGERVCAAMDELVDRFGRSSIERWSDAKWESFCLHALWRACCQGVHGLPAPPDGAAAPARHRDLLLAATGEDSDRLVHEALIPFCAAYLDQGLASWPLPGREQGFFDAFLRLYRPPGGSPEPWLRPLRAELERLASRRTTALDSIDESLSLLGVRDEDRPAYATASVLALRGWAGILWQVESRGDRAVHPVPAGSLEGFLAVRLLLDRLALEHLANRCLDFRGPLAELGRRLHARLPRRSLDVEQRAFLIFELAQALGWKPMDLFRLQKHEWASLTAEVEAFNEIERRRIFHLAYERRYLLQTLDALSVRAARPLSGPARPDYQAVFCIDEREESMRRHLEEVDPRVETFGVAGFFGVAMYYRGAADAHYVPLCPVVVVPRHYVQEVVVDRHQETHLRRGRIRRWLGVLSHRFHVGSRTGAGGAMLAGLFGPLATVPLVFRVLFPRLTAQIRRRAGRFVQPPEETDLVLERTSESPGPHPGGIGYSLAEMVDVVERLLRDVGLAGRCSPLVVVVGHGSSSLNNPHESAHDCGACGGNRGGPNARAFARMANDPRVRRELARRGRAIPQETVFVAAYHNTCDDAVAYFDLERVPPSHRGLLDRARRSFDAARARSAHERCRRFESASLRLTPQAALEHVEARAEDLSQVRPEYGHATNSICIVGRRSRTRGLFCDRRAFLASYDPTGDADGAVLDGILQAVVPVCAGINLEYYFSFVDPTGYGCGTKLPHNITSLLGVMDGAASDMRPGLPWQMIEIHEPVRLLLVLEAAPATVLRILDGRPSIARFVRNEWVRLATLDPNAPVVHVYRRGRFERHQPETTGLPEVESSVSWYRGWRDHLGFALVRGALDEGDAPPRRRPA